MEKNFGMSLSLALIHSSPPSIITRIIIPTHSLNVFFFFQQIFFLLSLSLFSHANWLIADMAECKVLKLSQQHHHHHHRATEATTHHHHRRPSVVKRQQLIISRLPQIIAITFTSIIVSHAHMAKDQWITSSSVAVLSIIVVAQLVAISLGAYRQLAFARRSLSWISSQPRRRTLPSTNSTIAY